MTKFLFACPSIMRAVALFAAAVFAACGEEKKEETVCECVARHYENADSALTSYVEAVAKDVDIEAQKDFARERQVVLDSIDACASKAQDFEEDPSICSDRYSDKLDSFNTAFASTLQETINRKTAEREEEAKKNAANPPKGKK